MKKIIALFSAVVLVTAGLVYHNRSMSEGTITSAVIGGPLTAFDAKLGTLRPVGNFFDYQQGTCTVSTWPEVFRIATDGNGRVVSLTYHDCRPDVPTAKVTDYLPVDETASMSAQLAGVESAQALHWCGYAVPNDGRFTVTHFSDGWQINVGPPC